jgi:ribosome-associated protein
MDTKNSLQINSGLAIPISELRFQFSRSSGAGGQNVNRVETRVELSFDIEKSRSLSDSQKQQINEALHPFIDKEGILHLESQETRSQFQNREIVLLRFAELLRQALRPRKKRKPTRPTKASKEKRLKTKKERQQAKERRRKVTSEW